MTRRLAALVPFVASFALLAACGSSTLGVTDGGTPPDGGGTLADGGGTLADGGAADAGIPDAGQPDAGRADGGRRDAGVASDGGLECLPTGCVNAAGVYNACVTCPVLGRLGPYPVDITQTTCQFTACTRTSPDAGQQCSDGCIDENGNLAIQIRAAGFVVDCTGVLNDTNPSNRTATLNCPVQGFGACSGDMREMNRTNCN